MTTPESTRESVEAAIADFAADLRALRDNAPSGAPTFEQLITSRRIARSTAYTALSGRRLPSPENLRMLVEAWGGDTQQWLDKRAAILRAQRAIPRASDTPESHPVKVGGTVALVFRVAGYYCDDNGELVAHLERVDHRGTVITSDALDAGLAVGNSWQLARPNILHGITTPLTDLKEEA